MQRVIASSISVKKKKKAYGSENMYIEPIHLLQFPAQPSPFLGFMENTTFVHLPKKSKYLKVDILYIISSNLVLASEWTTSQNHFVL